MCTGSEVVQRSFSINAARIAGDSGFYYKNNICHVWRSILSTSQPAKPSTVLFSISEVLKNNYYYKRRSRQKTFPYSDFFLSPRFFKMKCVNVHRVSVVKDISLKE